jgi:hypothetical protein
VAIGHLGNLIDPNVDNPRRFLAFVPKRKRKS